MQPFSKPPKKVRNRSKRLVLPISLLVIGAGAITTAAFLLLREQEHMIGEENADVENFDIVSDTPFFSRPMTHKTSVA